MPRRPVKWTAGIFFQHLRENVRESSYDTVLASTIFGCDPTTIACQQGLLFDLNLDQTVDQQIATFGDLTAKVTDSLSVTVGVRVSHDEVRTISEGPLGDCSSAIPAW